MKRFIILLIIMTLLIVSVGCSNNDNVEVDNNRFVDTGDGYSIGNMYYRVYYDTKTNIVYFAEASAYRSGISVMYNSEGNPMTIEEYQLTR